MRLTIWMTWMAYQAEITQQTMAPTFVPVYLPLRWSVLGRYVLLPLIGSWLPWVGWSCAWLWIPRHEPLYPSCSVPALPIEWGTSIELQRISELSHRVRVRIFPPGQGVRCHRCPNRVVIWTLG